MSEAGFGLFRRKGAPSKTEPRKRRRTPGIIALEPRMMYDGAAAATVAVAHHHHGHDGPHGDPSHAADGGKTPANIPVTTSGNIATGNDNRWHPATHASEPMPQVVSGVRDPKEILFVDSQVPDYQALVAGAKPGVEVVVINPDSDGVQQIANFLDRHPHPDLTTIDIVAHGAQGDLLLGSTNLGDANLSADAAALGRIGSALKPGGGIMLYGCNVASGAEGMQFITDLSKDAGGVDVQAATHDIGMTANGPNWTLDTATGTLVASSPFTAEAMASFDAQLGGEVQVNTTGGVFNGHYGDTTAEVAALANGDYVVAWEVSGGARARIFNASGTALGNDFAIPNIGTTYGYSIAALPDNSAASLPDGGYVVTYATPSGIFGEIFDVTAAGAVTQVGSQFTIGSGTSYSTAVAVAADGSFMVTWDSGLTVAYAQLYNASHAAVGGAIQVSPTTFFQTPPRIVQPSIAALSNGGFVIAYGGEVDQNFDDQVFTAVYNSSGGLVSKHTVAGSSSFLDTEVAGLAGGGFAMVWNDGSNHVIGQVFNNSGGSVSGQFGVTSDNGGQLEPAVVATPDGGFLVEWNGYGGGGYGSDIGAQRYDASGNKLGTAFQIDVPAQPGSSTGGANFQSPIAVLANHQVVVAFTDNSSSDSAASNVFVDQFVMHSAPSGVDITKTIIENQSYTLQASDFGFSDPLDGDSFAGVVITTLPTSGTLKDNGTAVTVGGLISIADINAGKLVFTPATNSSGSPDSHFTFQVEDNGGNTTPNVNLDQSANTFTFNVTPLLPVVTAGAVVSFTGGGAAVALDSGLTLTDPGSTTAASATISISSGYIAGDTLNFTNVAADGNIAFTSYSNGVLTLTSAGHTATLAQWQAALESVTYSFTAGGDPTGGGSHTTRTISWVVNDGNASNAAVTSTLNTSHAAPSVTAGGSAAFVQGGSAVTLDGSVAITAPDSAGDLSSATVSVAGGVFATDGDTLSATAVGNITVSYNASTETLTLSGKDTVAHYLSVLDSVKFSSTGATAGSRTIDWAVNDGVASSATATSLVSVHDLPVVTAGATATYKGGDASATLDGGLTVTDANSGGAISSATITISSGYIAGDTLNFTNVAADGNIAVSSNGNGKLVLTSSGSTATLAQWDAALQSVTYSDGNNDPTGGGADTSRTISWVVNDGVANSTAATSTLKTVHVAPVVTAGASVTYHGGDSPLVLDGALALGDVDSAGDLTGATVSIGTGFINGDLLNFANQNGISGTYDATKGILTLTGKASVTDYQTALQSVTYSDGNNDPTGGGSDTSRTISWTVNDGVASTTDTSTLTTVHTPPTVTAGAGVTYHGGDAPLVLDGSLALGDVDSAGNLTGATVSIGTGFINGDLLNFADQNGISGSYDATRGLLTLTGTASVADYQAALQSITYSDGNNDPTGGGSDTSRTISWTVNDGVASTTDTSTLTTVHTPPTVVAGASVTYHGGDAPLVLDGALTLNDVDSAGSLTGATVSIGAGFINGDLLNFADQNGISGTYDATKGILTLTGKASVTDYQTALQSVTYSDGNNDPTGGGSDTSRVISWTVNDGVATATDSSALGTVHTPPAVVAGASATYHGGGAPLVLDGALTLNDVDSAGNLTGATVSIGAGFINGDVLNVADQNGITGSYDAVHGILTLTGKASVADYQAALQSVTYSDGNNDPTGGGSDTSRVIGWTVNDGVASTTDTSTLTTVHTPPTVTAGASVTYHGGDAPLVLDGALALSDVDSAGNLTGATVSIGAGFINGDVLNFANQSGISGSYDATRGLLTLTGTASVADYQAALRSITYSDGNNDPTGGGSDTSRAISWTVNDGVASTTDTSALTTVHTPPTVTAGASVTYHGGDAPLVLDGSLALGDVDSASNLTGATVSIGVGFINGDLLNFTNQNGINGSYDAAKGILTLTGKASVADYQAALQSVTYSDGNNDPTGGGSDTSRTISWTVNDGVASTTDSSALTTVHTPPTVTAGASVIYHGGDAPLVLDGSLALGDVDSAGNLTGARVSIGAGFIDGDLLNFVNQNGISGSYDAAKGILTLTGTASVADYQVALQSVTYSDGNNDPTGGGQDISRTVSWTVNDGVAGTTATSTLTTVHVAPVVTPSGNTATFHGGDPSATLDGALTVSDVDSAGNLTGATVSIGTGFIAGDTLNFTAQNGITGSYDAAHGVLILSGRASLADYQAALDSIGYSFTAASKDPTNGGGDISRTISWTVNDGVAGSAAVTSVLDTVHVAPVVTAVDQASFNANGLEPVALDPALSLQDIDKTTLSGAQVAISSGLVAANDSLGFVNGNGITGSYNGATGVLTLTGVASVADYQAALERVTFFTTTQLDGTRTIQWSVDDGNSQFNLSQPVTTALNVQGLFIQPHPSAASVVAPASVTFVPAALVISGDTIGPLAPAIDGEGFAGGNGGGGYYAVHTDAVLNTASDATIQINLALAALEAPLGGDVSYVTARLVNGDPLPDWLKFDPRTGTFAGTPPQGMVASLAPDQAADNDVVTGTLNPDFAPGDGGGQDSGGNKTLTVEVLARDSRGNIAVTLFTIDLKDHGKHGWNIDRDRHGFGLDRHAAASDRSIEGADRGTVAPSARPMPPARHGEALPSGRAGLTEQMAGIGWRSMAAQRNALLASLQQGR